MESEYSELKVVYGDDEKIQSAMLAENEPFKPNKIMEDFDRGRVAILNHIDSLETRGKLFKQQVGSKRYYISREKLKPEEIVKDRKHQCAYHANDEVSKIMCELVSEDGKPYCLKLKFRSCDLYNSSFKKND